MKMLAIIFVILAILFLWMMIDYTLGRKRHIDVWNGRRFRFEASDIKLFASGPELFEDYFAMLKEAKHHIHILFYIVQKR